MSLATSGGIGGMGGAGAAGGGLAMAHHANAIARPAAQPNAGTNSIPLGTAPPSSAAAALGADLVDKQQQISLKQVKDLSHMPLVAIDLYAKEPFVASFPPKPSNPSDQVNASLVGKMKDRISLKVGEASHKTFRKWLSKSKGYQDLQAEVLAPPTDSSAVVIQSPQQWVGLRRLGDAPEFLKKTVNQDDSTSPAIAEESSQGVGATMANGTLDGSVPQGDDFDRVVCKVRLNDSKKALTVLPEEMTQLILNQAQYHVARKTKGADEEDIVNYPCCIAVPAAYCNDVSMEALMDAANGTGVFMQRSVCALAGSLLPSTEESKPNLLSQYLGNVLQAMHKEFQKVFVKNPDAQFEDNLILLLIGLTQDSCESTAIEISESQPNKQACPFGNFKVLSSVSKRHENPESMIDQSISELFDSLDKVAPEADGPVAMVSYGSAAEQKAMNGKWENLKKKLEDWEDVPHFYTKPDSVALGTSVLGAVSHGRLSTVAQVQGKKPKAKLAIRVQNVAPVAVGVRMNYQGGAKGKWTVVKTVFDFDRRVPAGPYQIDLTAAECMVHRNGGVGGMSDEQLLKAIKDNEGSKYIPKREEAALNLRVQIVQKWTRDGDWKDVGDVMSPLVVVEKDDSKTACEKVVLELSLGSTGLITNSLVGDRESVVQATQSARNSALRWYLGVFFAVAFFGGFLIKSYWEERVFERDTRRLLAYYRNVIPGSMSDGDERNARYVVWKYRNKKEKLWKSLEKKYGEPALQEHEWPEIVEEESAATEEDAENLDEEEPKSEQDL